MPDQAPPVVLLRPNQVEHKTEFGKGTIWVWSEGFTPPAILTPGSKRSLIASRESDIDQWLLAENNLDVLQQRLGLARREKAAAKRAAAKPVANVRLQGPE
jgi:hypothetical protein